VNPAAVPAKVQGFERRPISNEADEETNLSDEELAVVERGMGSVKKAGIRYPSSKGRMGLYIPE
jgi:hypothetical protein